MDGLYWKGPLNLYHYLLQLTWNVNQKWNWVKFKLVRTLLRITHLAHRKSYLVIICPNSTFQVIICSNLVLSTLIWPKILFLSIFSLTYLYLPLFTYIWLYLGLITLIWAYLPLIALILPYVTLFTLYNMHYSIETTSVQNFRAIGPLFMDIAF